jgi:hypothetical protein
MDLKKAAYVMVALFFGLAFASVNPKVELVNYSVSESPLTPGHVVALSLQLQSIEWDHCAENVAVQLSTPYPLSIDGPDTQYLGKLCFNDGPEAGTVTFNLPVDSLAQAGTYQVAVSTTYEKSFSKFSESNTVNLRVGGTPELRVTVLSSSPVDIYPGDSATVTMSIYNSGNDRAESVLASLDAPSGITVKWSAAAQEAGTIASNSASSVKFDIETDKNASPGDYTLRMHVDYSASNGSKRGINYNFAIPLKQKAEFSAIGSAAPLYIGETQQAQVEVRNTGTEAAKKLKIRIHPAFPFSSDGTIRYVDSLAPNESVLLNYTITIDTTADPGSAQSLGVLVDYENAQGKAFEDSSDFFYTTTTRTLEEQVRSHWYIVALVAVVLAYVILGRLLRKKDK